MAVRGSSPALDNAEQSEITTAPVNIAPTWTRRRHDIKGSSSGKKAELLAERRRRWVILG
jgi:hypothetical protein